MTAVPGLLAQTPYRIPDVPLKYSVYVGLLLGLAFLLAIKLPKKAAISGAVGSITILSSWAFRDGAAWNWPGGLFLGLIFGLPGGLAGVTMAKRDQINIAERLTWSWQRAMWGMLAGLTLMGMGLVKGLRRPFRFWRSMYAMILWISLTLTSFYPRRL